MKVCRYNQSTDNLIDFNISAIRAARDIVQAPDFDRKMLLLATRLSHESNMKGLLLSVLDALLHTLNSQEGNNFPEAMILIRCSIRLIIKLLAEPAANRYAVH